MHKSREKKRVKSCEKQPITLFLLYNVIMTNITQQGEYIAIQQGCQQLKLAICGRNEISAEKSEFYRQVSAQLGRLDYRKLYSAYSGTIRKSQVEPRILFEIIVCAYMKGIYSSRKIEELCRENIQFILILDGHEPPDHCTIARFRSGEDTAPAIEDLFYQYAAILEQEGLTNHEEVFIDGTKIESKANRYTFVWRKVVEQQLKKIKSTVKEMLHLDEGYTTKGKLEEHIRELNEQVEQKGLNVQKGRGHHKPTEIRERDKLQELLDHWNGYEKKLKTLGEGRNSYSKTDPDATFMHMKDDHMRNGQLKPGYNVQFAVNSEFITGIGVFPDRTDYDTLPGLLEKIGQRHGQNYKRVVADAGYESLKNYRYLSEQGIAAYIKPNNYESSRTRKFRAQIGRAENMAYYRPGDYYICKNERILSNVGTSTEYSKDGTIRIVTRYRCEDCHSCPYRAQCCKARDPEQQKELVVYREFSDFRQSSLERITAEEGKLLRVNRSIQSEGAFGQLKHNRHFVRFLTGGNLKVLNELLFLALSQNIMKYISKCNTGKADSHLLKPISLLKF